MTEDQAKTKWCPMARSVPNAVGYSSGNRFDGQNPEFLECKCIASDCMMWAKATEIFHIDDDGKETVIPKKKSGRCGLAK